MPQNVAIKGLLEEEKWPKEWKPTLAAFLAAMAILLHVAAICNEPVFFFSDDIKACFNQLFLAPQQWHKAVSMFRDRTSSNPLFIVEYMMPFGIQCASNIAQGWTHLLVHLVRHTMDAMEAAAVEKNPAVVAWVVERESHFKGLVQQRRLYFDGCFTDDLAAAIVGVERTTRYLMAWHEVTTRFNIMMAPPRKRQLGCRLLWVGALLLTIGLVTVSLQKRIRAIYKLKLLLAGKLSMSQLQKLNGLLQHFVSVFALKHNWTSGMYVLFNAAEMDGGVLRHPEARAEPTRHMEQTAGKWLVFLRDLAGSSACTFTSERNPITELSRFISSHSDAASEVVMGIDPDTGLGIGLGALILCRVLVELAIECGSSGAPDCSARAAGTCVEHLGVWPSSQGGSV